MYDCMYVLNVYCLYIYVPNHKCKIIILNNQSSLHIHMNVNIANTCIDV